MERRTFLAGTGAVLFAAPLAAEAQQVGKIYRIGHLAIAGPTDTPPPPPANWESFQQGLRELGYVEGQNIAFEHRYAHGRFDLFPGLAADLVRLQVDIIFARGPQAVTAAKNATRAIPIVGIDLESDPVMTGLVTSISRPGGNITGMFLDLAELSGKQLQLLKELVPKLLRVAVLGDPAVNASQLSALNDAGRALAVHVQVLELKSSGRLDGAFEEAKKGRAQALVTLSNPLNLSSRSRIGALATKRRLPTMFPYRAHVEAGGLMSYGPDLPGMHRRCADYVVKILKGAKPSDLPVERPVKFELVINLKTAKALGLTIPQSVLGRADEVIQ
jgi:putative tryptophan/tyrosine transport system substrate-binding protein